MSRDLPDSAPHDADARSHPRSDLAAPALPAGDSTDKRQPSVRRITTEAAASYVGRPVRTLEDWRQSWWQAVEEGKPELGKGPKFYKVGKRVLYDVRDLDDFIAAGRTRGLHRA